MADHVFAESPVRASVSSASRATPEQLVDLAKGIWGEILKSGVAAEDAPGNDALLERLQGKHKDFNASFPVVLRWMVQLRKFRPKAFKHFLLKHASAKLDSREGFLELQAEYLAALFREEHPHIDEGKVRAYRDKVVAALLEEDREFARIQAEVEKDVAAREAENDRERRQRLYEALLAQKVAKEKGGSG